MQIFNIGPLELILILLLALIIMGPERMISSARKVGKLVSQLVRSPIWSSIMDTTREIRELPRKFVSDTGFEDDWKEIQQSTNQISKDLKEVRTLIGKSETISLQTTDHIKGKKNKIVDEAPVIVEQQVIEESTITEHIATINQQNENTDLSTLPPEDKIDHTSS